MITPKPPAKKEPVEGEEPAEAEPEMDEEELAKMLKPQLQTNIYPGSVISF